MRTRREEEEHEEEGGRRGRGRGGGGGEGIESPNHNSGGHRREDLARHVVAADAANLLELVQRHMLVY